MIPVIGLILILIILLFISASFFKLLRTHYDHMDAKNHHAYAHGHYVPEFKEPLILRRELIIIFSLFVLLYAFLFFARNSPFLSAMGITVLIVLVLFLLAYFLPKIIRSRIK